jgi:thymidylate kinase
MEPVKLVTLEGLVGVGKSSQLALLRERFSGEDVVFLEEPVDKWMDAGLLQGFYSGHLSASVFQMSVLVSLFGPLFSAVLRRPKLIVSERSPFSNSAVFAKANLHGAELAAYHYTLRELMQALPPVDVTAIYLVTSVKTAMDRVRQRNRDAESELSQDYMQLLHDLHDRLEFSLPAGGTLVRVSADGSLGETELKILDAVTRVGDSRSWGGF